MFIIEWWSRTLVVEGHPLRLAGSLNVLEGNGAVVAVDASQDDAVGAEVLFLVSTIEAVKFG
jgi:hypothetical protein